MKQGPLTAAADEEERAKCVSFAADPPAVYAVPSSARSSTVSVPGEGLDIAMQRQSTLSSAIPSEIAEDDASSCCSCCCRGSAIRITPPVSPLGLIESLPVTPDAGAGSPAPSPTPNPPAVEGQEVHLTDGKEEEEKIALVVDDSPLNVKILR